MRRRGVVLVISLAVLAGLIFIVAAMAASNRIALQAEGNRLDIQRARLAANAGIQRAIASIGDTIQDTTNAAAGPTTVSTTVQGQAQTQTDEWYTLGSKGDERFVVGAASFRIEIVDAGGLVNLNTAPETQLDLLPLTTEQVAAILDWREPGATARTEGAKDDYYSGLTKPYNAKLRRFDSVDELLDVRYFTAADLYTLSGNTTGSGNAALPALPDGREAVLADLVTTNSFSAQLAPGGGPLVNVNTANAATRLQAVGVSPQAAQAIQQGGIAYADLGAVLARVGQADYGAVLDNVTTTATPRVEGKINLNTASEAVLTTLPEMTPDLAQGIVNYQATGFNRLSDLLLVSGFTDTATLRRYAGYFTVRSSVFLVRVVGVCNGSQVAREGVVDTSSGTARLVKMQDLPFSDMPTRWGWNADATNDTVLVEAS